MSLAVTRTTLIDTLRPDAAREDRKGGSPDWSVGALRQSGLLEAIAVPDRRSAADRLPALLATVRDLAEVDGSIAEIVGSHLVATLIRALSGRPRSEAAPLLAFGVGNLTASRRGNDLLLSGEVNGFAGSGSADRLVLQFRDEAGGIFLAEIQGDASGLTRDPPADTVGQRQNAAAPLRLDGVRVTVSLLAPSDAALIPALLAGVRIHLLGGLARGAIGEGRRYTIAKSRSWVYSGYEKHTEDPFVQRRYGDLHIRNLAGAELAEAATRRLVSAIIAKAVPSADLIAALDTAEIWAGDTALAAGAGVFEVMGARSATKENGYDRFWRNARTITLDHPSPPKQIAIGDWLLT